MTIAFINDGLMDIKSLTLHGVSVKVTDNPVGQFGTGLKLAISTLIREGCDIEIVIGKKVFNIVKQKEMFRDKKITQLFLCEVGGGDPQYVPLPFVVDYGLNWKPLHALRELWCNAFDEPNPIVKEWDTENDVIPDDTTAILVTGEAIDDAWKKRGEMFLSVALENGDAEIVWEDDYLQAIYLDQQDD